MGRSQRVPNAAQIFDRPDNMGRHLTKPSDLDRAILAAVSDLTVIRMFGEIYNIVGYRVDLYPRLPATLKRNVVRVAHRLYLIEQLYSTAARNQIASGGSLWSVKTATDPIAVSRNDGLSETFSTVVQKFYEFSRW